MASPRELLAAQTRPAPTRRRADRGPVGPIPAQTWALTAVPSILGVFFVTLFTVFGRPDIGMILVALVLLPIVMGAWWDYAIMAGRARRYRREADEYSRLRGGS